jgi:hypothetical protein
VHRDLQKSDNVRQKVRENHSFDYAWRKHLEPLLLVQLWVRIVHLGHSNKLSQGRVDESHDEYVDHNEPGLIDRVNKAYFPSTFLNDHEEYVVDYSNNHSSQDLLVLVNILASAKQQRSRLC